MAPWSDDATLGSGLPDRFLFTVTSAKVGRPFPKQADQTAVILDGEQNVDGNVEDQHMWLKAGAFEAGDAEGTFLIHETQTPDIFDTKAEKPKKINKTSSYGKFLGSAMAVDKAALVANQDPSREKYEIWDVKFWEGLTLDIQVKEEGYDFKNDAGEQIKGSKRQEYVVGIVGTGGQKSAPAAEAPAASSNGKVNPADHENFISYLESYIAAGGKSDDPEAQKSYFEAAKS